MDTVTCNEGDTARSREPLAGWREVLGTEPAAERLHSCSLLCDEMACGRRQEENSQAAPASATAAAQGTERSQELARELWRVPPRMGDYRAEDHHHEWPISRRIRSECQACPRISPYIPEDLTPRRLEDHKASSCRRKEAGAESEDLVDSEITGESITIQSSRTELWPPKDAP